METRLVIAYLLIALIIGSAVVLARHIAIKRRTHRRLMRGHGAHKRASARR